MPSILREFAFSVNDVARLLRTYADQKAGQFGMTRAQWAVLARLESHQGLKQSELAEMLDLQPITLTRLVDRLCDNGLIERRADPDDRRAKRLFLTPAARAGAGAAQRARRGLLGEALERAAIPADDRAISTASLPPSRPTCARPSKNWSESSLNEQLMAEPALKLAPEARRRRKTRRTPRRSGASAASACA